MTEESPNVETSSDQKPSEEFLKAIFGDSDDSDITDTEDEKIDDQKTVVVPFTSESFKTDGKKKSITTEKVITVMDMDLSSDKDDDNEEFGPVPPPPTSLSKADLGVNIVDSKGNL